MTKKLTLSIEQQVIKTAKKYALAEGRSLSDVVENYLRTLSSNLEQPKIISPKTKRLLGAIKLPENFDYKKALAESVAEKYGK
jgi:PhoPQ-activated pathogenicity-related protein